MILVLRLSEDFLTFGALHMWSIFAVVETMALVLLGLNKVMTKLAVNCASAPILYMVLNDCWLLKLIVLLVAILACVLHFIFAVITLSESQFNPLSEVYLTIRVIHLLVDGVT